MNAPDTVLMGKAAMLLAGAALAVVGLALLLPHRHGRLRTRWAHLGGALATALGALLLASLWSPPADVLSRLFFYALGLSAIGAAVATVTARDPVNNALAFAAVLLAVAGLLLLAGAQFLAVGTVIVYAGAIVVMFLFVIMLAQAEGQAFYDRMARAPVRSALTGLALLAAVAYAILVVQLPNVSNRWLPDNEAQLRNLATAGLTLDGFRDARTRVRNLPRAELERYARRALDGGASQTDFDQRLPRLVDLRSRADANKLDPAALAVIDRSVSPTARMPEFPSDAASRGVPPPHVAGLGGTLFTDHLVTVEVVGAVLFVALVGAIAIATPRRRPAA